MLLILLPNTNIYKTPHIPPDEHIPPFNESEPICQSAQYYLSKQPPVDDTPFNAIYRAVSKINAYSQSFFTFIEMIGHFELHNYAPYVSYFYKEASQLDWGIIQAFYYKNPSIIFNLNNPSMGEPPPPPPQFEYIQITSKPIYIPHIIVMERFQLVEQSVGTTLIVKIENCFDEYTIKTLYYLCSSYDKVFIAKPTSSWEGSPIKYVIAFRFKGTNVRSIKMLKPTNIFLTKMAEINCIFVQPQIETLSGNRGKIYRSYQQKCIHWFIKYGVEYSIPLPSSFV